MPVEFVVTDGQRQYPVNLATQAELNAHGGLVADPMTVDTLPVPTFVPHRGGMGENVTPEGMRESFLAGFSAGLMVQDGGDIHTLGDGTLVNMHQTDLADLTTGTGDLKRHDAISWQALQGDPQNFANPWPNWPSSQATLTTFEDLCQMFKRFGGVMIPENKEQTAAVTNQMLTVIQKYGLERQCIFSSFNDASLVPARQAGLKIMKIAAAGTPPTLAALKAAGVDYLNYDYSATSFFTAPYLQSLYDAGIKLSPYTILRRTQYEAELARVGRTLDLPYCGDPLWVSGTSLVRLNDPYPTKQPWVGMLPAPGTKLEWRTGDKFGFDFAGAALALQGWGCKSTGGTAQTSLQFDLTFETLLADLTRFALVNFFMTNDYSLGNGNWPAGASGGGYKLIMKQNGDITLSKTVAGGSASQLGATLSTAGFVAGTPVTFVIDRPGTGAGGNDIRVTRTDTGDTLTRNDGSYRGDMFDIGMQGTGGGANFQPSWANWVLTP